MRKRILTMVICLVLFAAFCGSYAESTVTPRYAYVDVISASLSISSGVAKAAGGVIPSANQDTSIVVKLQRENSSGRWSTIAYWSGTTGAGGTKAVESGYKYQVCVTAKVYDDAGNVLETVTKYTSTKTY